MIKEKEKTESYFLKDLAEKVNTKFNRSLSSNSISDILRRLNFKERTRHGQGTVFNADMERVTIQKNRIGLVSEEDGVFVSASLSSQSSLSSLEGVVGEVSEESEPSEEGKKSIKKIKIPDQKEDIKKVYNFAKLDSENCFEWNNDLNNFIRNKLEKLDPEAWINKNIEKRVLEEPVLGKLRFLYDFSGDE
jgi:hypothetical protein